MKYYKKTAAFLMGIAVALSAAAPSFSAFAEDDEDLVILDNDGNIIREEKAEDTVTESGDFKYSANDDGTVTLISCMSSEEEITIPAQIDGKKISGIAGGAFAQLSSKKVTIPADADYDITENPFAAAILLEEFNVEEGNKNWTVKDGILFSKDLKKLISYPAAKAGKSYVIPEGTEEIGIAAFYEADAEELTIASSLKTLNRHCFSYMTNLKKIDMSVAKEIDTVPPMAFVEASSLSSVIFPENLIKIDLAAFMNCKELKEVELPEMLESVGQSAFMGTGLSQIIIPDSVMSIGYNAFGYKDDNSDIPGFEIIGSVNGAGYTYSTDSDAEYDYSNDFVFTSRQTYERKKLLETMDVETSGDYNYAVNDDGTAILISCDSIDYTVTVPDEIDGHKVTSVFANAFLGSISKEIILPDSITSIGTKAFSSEVEKLTLPGNLTEFEDDEPFLSLTNLSSISVGSGDGNFSAENGVLYNKDKTLLVCYPQAKKDQSFTTPSGLKNIAMSAFCYNTLLEEADLSSVELISDYAFEGCTALKDVRLSRNLRSVGQNAFLGCTELSGIRVYRETESIGQYAFGYTYDAELEADIRNNPENYADDEDGVVMPYSVIPDFTMYVEKESVAERYALDCGIATAENTVAIGKTNVDVKLFYGLGGIAGLGIIGVIIRLVLSKVKKKKKK